MPKFKVKGKPNYIDDLITEAIDCLADDDITNGTGAMMEIAEAFAKGGQTLAAWLDLRTYIVKSAVQQNKAILIPEKVAVAEIKRREDRNGTLIITN